jgi:hypothetical protein
MATTDSKALTAPLSQSDLARVLDAIQSGDDSQNARLIKAAVERLTTPSINDIWHDNQASISHWVLLLNGINNADEHRLASELLVWQGCFAGPDARVRCIQTSERNMFAFSSRHFGVTSPPVLFISGDLLFTRNLKIDTALLARLAEKENGLQRFFTKIHTAFLHGQSVEDIATELATDQFWHAMKIIYKETKGLFSIQIKAGP